MHELDSCTVLHLDRCLAKLPFDCVPPIETYIYYSLRIIEEALRWLLEMHAGWWPKTYSFGTGHQQNTLHRVYAKTDLPSLPSGETLSNPLHTIVSHSNDSQGSYGVATGKPCDEPPPGERLAASCADAQRPESR